MEILEKIDFKDWTKEEVAKGAEKICKIENLVDSCPDKLINNCNFLSVVKNVVPDLRRELRNEEEKRRTPQDARDKEFRSEFKNYVGDIFKDVYRLVNRTSLLDRDGDLVKIDQDNWDALANLWVKLKKIVEPTKIMQVERYLEEKRLGIIVNPFQDDCCDDD